MPNDSVSDDDVQKMLDDLNIEKTLDTLKLLAENFTKKTTLMPVQYGIRNIRIPMKNSYSKKYDFPHRIVEIQMHWFFGMVIGYNEELDILAYWLPKKEIV